MRELEAQGRFKREGEALQDEHHHRLHYCPVCGASLTDEAEVQMEDAKRIISNDKEVLRSILMELLEERGEAGIPAELFS